MTEDVAEFILSVFVLLTLGMIVTLRALAAPSGNGDSGRLLDLEMRFLLLLTATALVLVPIMDALVPWFEFADYRFRGALAWLGTFVAASSLWLLWCSRRDLRRFEGTRLTAPVEVGIHRFVRHPVYTALLLWAVAQWLLSQNLISGGLATLSFIALYVLRVPRDEQTLLEKFGYRYLEYMQRTGSVLPRLTRTNRR
jgi:protein-S-isoprenylcysteine O-methyltransferase Ste14